MKNDKVLITGVNGFIGQAVAESLAKEGYLIIGIDRSPFYLSRIFDDSKHKYIKADIRRPESFPAEARDVSVFVHCVFVKENQDGKKRITADAEAIKNILSFLNPERLSRLVFLSSVFVYGAVYREEVREETDLRPEEPYGKSKVLSEKEFIQFGKRCNVPYTIFRLTPVYSAKKMTNVEKRIFFPKKILYYIVGSGEQKFSLCALENVVNAVKMSIERPGFKNQVLIVGDKDFYSPRQIISLFKKNKNIIRPVIRIPLFLLNFFIFLTEIIFPQKIKRIRQMLIKISRDQKYSTRKIEHLFGENQFYNLGQIMR